MQFTYWVCLLTIFLDVQLCAHMSPGADAVIVSRGIRRIVRRLDRSANDVLDRVEDSIEREKDHHEHDGGRKRSRGRSRSRSHGVDLGGLGGIARPIIRQVLNSKRGLLGRVGVKANLDNGKWNVNLKIGGRKGALNLRTDTKRGRAKFSMDTKGSSGKSGNGRDVNTFGHLGTLEWPAGKGLPPNLDSINLHGFSHSTGGFTHNEGGSIGHGGGHYPIGGIAYGGHQQAGGWQPSAAVAAAGYHTGQTTSNNNNNNWAFHKRSSEKDDSGWSQESKEDAVFTRPKGKVGRKTVTTRRPASAKTDKGSSVRHSSINRKLRPQVTEANDVWDDSRESQSSEGDSRGSSKEIKKASASGQTGQISKIKANPVDESKLSSVHQHGKGSGQLGPMNIRIKGQDGFREGSDARGPQQDGLTHVATTPLTQIWASKPWNGPPVDGTTPRPLWSTHQHNVQSAIGQEQNNKAAQIHIRQSASGGQVDKQANADGALTDNRWQIATTTSSEESSWLRRLSTVPGLQTDVDNSWTPIVKRTSPEETPVAAASEVTVATTPSMQLVTPPSGSASNLTPSTNS